ncbi:MAG: hypothetical protein J2P41_06150 [Blastocatellia bacterium]|nr:hypothetical protein [Blastocatellia bacterium]
MSKAVQALGQLGDARALPALTWLQNHYEDRLFAHHLKSDVTVSIKMIAERTG